MYYLLDGAQCCCKCIFIKKHCYCHEKLNSINREFCSDIPIFGKTCSDIPVSVIGTVLYKNSLNKLYNQLLKITRKYLEITINLFPLRSAFLIISLTLLGH